MKITWDKRIFLILIKMLEYYRIMRWMGPVERIRGQDSRKMEVPGVKDSCFFLGHNVSF